MELGMNSHGHKNSKRAQNGAVLAEINRHEAQQFAENLRPILLNEMLNAGSSKKARANKALARALNAKGVATARGGRWHTETVRRLRKRLGPEFMQEFREARKEQAHKIIAEEATPELVASHQRNWKDQ